LHCLDGAAELKALKLRYDKGEDIMSSISPVENARLWKVSMEQGAASGGNGKRGEREATTTMTTVTNNECPPPAP